MKKGHYFVFFSLLVALSIIIFLAKIRGYQEAERVVSSKQEKNRPPLITSEEAQAIACNSFQETQTGIKLIHPNHQVIFEKKGVLFQPKKGPEWAWQLEHIGTQEEPLKSISLYSAQPENNHDRIVEYHYGSVVEQYHAKANTVEQRFVLEKPLDLKGQDLVIRGNVKSEGKFEEFADGWIWSDDEGQVVLGDVTVFDAHGKILVASMQVSAHQTEIVVESHSLATATYPVTVDPEIGANDFRISDMGPNGFQNFLAFNPAVAYNSVNDEYLVVWHADDNTGFLVDNEFEIYGQRIDASTGLEVGVNDFRISDMGSDGDTQLAASDPSVTYNSKNNEYLVVWQGIDDGIPQISGEIEIYGQRLDASTGLEVGANDFRISDMGPDGSADFVAINPVAAYNSSDNEYFVVWEGTDDTSELVQDESEIFGQRLDASTGLEVGVNDFRISDMGPNGDSSFDAFTPAIAYNSADNEYFVVWQGDDGVFPLVNNEQEIFGQRLDAATGLEIGTNDFRISDMGPDGDPVFGAILPAVAYNSNNNEYLVTWTGDDNTSPLVNNEREIFGQRVDATTGAELGNNDFRISDMGSDGDIALSALQSKVIYNSIDNEYFVAWFGDDDVPPLVDGEIEMFGQRLDGKTGAELGENDFRISDMGPDGSVVFDVFSTALTYNSTDNECLIVWSGDDSTFPLVNNEREIFGQRFSFNKLASDINQLSLMSGGTQTLLIDFGDDFAGCHYLVLGSLIGTSPGIFFGGQMIPLNIGAYFVSTLNNPNSGTLPDGFGILDANGQATVQFVLPPGLDLPSGTVVHHAVVVIDVQPTLVKFSAVSNAEPCTLESASNH